jgi:hypothetical protein
MHAAERAGLLAPVSDVLIKKTAAASGPLGARELRRFCLWVEKGLDLLFRDFGEVDLLPIYLGAFGVEFV